MPVPDTVTPSRVCEWVPDGLGGECLISISSRWSSAGGDTIGFVRCAGGLVELLFITGDMPAMLDSRETLGVGM